MTWSPGNVHINNCQNVTRTPTSFSQLQPLFCDGRWIISIESHASFCFSKAWLNSARACDPASPPTSPYLSTQGWPSPNLRPTWCRWPTLIWILESSIHFGPWANLGVLGNPEQLSFNEIVGHPLIYLDGALEMSHSGFFPELEISINAAPCSVVWPCERRPEWHLQWSSSLFYFSRGWNESDAWREGTINRLPQTMTNSKLLLYRKSSHTY